MNKTERELELSDCDIEIQKYHMSMALTLLLPFILTFASAGMATSNQTLKTFFIALSIILLFFLAYLIFNDSKGLKRRYEHRRNIILKRHS